MTTIEFEPGAVHDLNRVFEALAPRDGEYQHHLRWGDDNGSSHVRAALLSHRAVQGRRAAARSMAADRALRVRHARLDTRLSSRLSASSSARARPDRSANMIRCVKTLVILLIGAAAADCSTR